jgi:hypothetical protein
MNTFSLLNQQEIQHQFYLVVSDLQILYVDINSLLSCDAGHLQKPREGSRV